MIVIQEKTINKPYWTSMRFDEYIKSIDIEKYNKYREYYEKEKAILIDNLVKYLPRVMMD